MLSSNLIEIETKNKTYKYLVFFSMLSNGKYFWLRSIGASGISETLFSMFSTFIIQYGNHSLKVIGFIIIASITVKLIYTISLAIPANIIVFFLKKTEGI